MVAHFGVIFAILETIVSKLFVALVLVGEDVLLLVEENRIKAKTLGK